MAIVFYAVQGAGFGNLLYALKVASYLQKRFYPEPLLLVSDEGGAKIMKSLSADQALGVTVIINEDFYLKLQKDLNLKINYYIEGPILRYRSSYLQIPKRTRILHVMEYGVSAGEWTLASRQQILDHYEKDREFLHYYKADVIGGGFSKYKDYKEEGIILTPELYSLDEKAKNHFGEEIGHLSQELMAKLFNRFPVIERIGYDEKPLTFSLSDVENYRKSNELFLEYSHGLYGLHAFERFIFIHCVLYGSHDKNQDIVSIGGDFSKKSASLEQTLEALKKMGYTFVSVINYEKENEKVLWNDPKKQPQKHYRMLWFPNISHRLMIALMGFSEKLCGVTGDQSLSEAMDKLICYETLPHKQNLVESFIELLAQDGSPDAAKLGTYLMGQGNNDDKALEEFKSLLQNEAVLAAYFQATKKIREGRDLRESIFDKISRQFPKEEINPSELAQIQRYLKKEEILKNIALFLPLALEELPNLQFMSSDKDLLQCAIIYANKLALNEMKQYAAKKPGYDENIFICAEKNLVCFEKIENIIDDAKEIKDKNNAKSLFKSAFSELNFDSFQNTIIKELDEKKIEFNTALQLIQFAPWDEKEITISNKEFKKSLDIYHTEKGFSRSLFGSSLPIKNLTILCKNCEQRQEPVRKSAFEFCKKMIQKEKADAFKKNKLTATEKVLNDISTKFQPHQYPLAPKKP